MHRWRSGEDRCRRLRPIPARDRCDRSTLGSGLKWAPIIIGAQCRTPSDNGHTTRVEHRAPIAVTLCERYALRSLSVEMIDESDAGSGVRVTDGGAKIPQIPFGIGFCGNELINSQLNQSRAVNPRPVWGQRTSLARWPTTRPPINSSGRSKTPPRPPAPASSAPPGTAPARPSRWRRSGGRALLAGPGCGVAVHRQPCRPAATW